MSHLKQIEQFKAELAALGDDHDQKSIDFWDRQIETIGGWSLGVFFTQVVGVALATIVVLAAPFVSVATGIVAVLTACLATGASAWLGGRYLPARIRLRRLRRLLQRRSAPRIVGAGDGSPLALPGVDRDSR